MAMKLADTGRDHRARKSGLPSISKETLNDPPSHHRARQSAEENEYAKPVDYHALLDDTTFKNILAEGISLKGFSIATNKATALEIDALIAAIDSEVSMLRAR